MIIYVEHASGAMNNTSSLDGFELLNSQVVAIYIENGKIDLKNIYFSNIVGKTIDINDTNSIITL